MKSCRIALKEVGKGDKDFEGALSPGMAFVELAKTYQGQAHSYTNRPRGRSNVYLAIVAAIELGFPFDVEDFEKNQLLENSYINGRRSDGTKIVGEDLYALACGHRFGTASNNPVNTSACRSIEHLLGRPPFVWMNRRVYVGRRFDWDGDHVKCTSFAQDGQSIVVVASCRLPKRRRKRITIDEMKSAEKKRLVGQKDGGQTRGVIQAVNFDSLDDAREVCAGLEVSEAEESMATKGEGQIAEKVFNLSRHDQPAFYPIVSQWIDGEQPVGVTVIGLLAVYRALMMGQGAVIARLGELLERRLENLLGSPHSKVRHCVAIICSAMYERRVFCDPARMARAINARVGNEPNEEVESEMREFLGLTAKYIR